MYRLLLVVSLLALLIYLLRNVFRGSKRKEGGGHPVQGDQMEQDPVCKVFIPRGSAIIRQVDAVTHYFCSQTCAEEFQKQQRS